MLGRPHVLAASVILGGGCASAGVSDTAPAPTRPLAVDGHLVEAGIVVCADPSGRASPLHAPSVPGDFPSTQPSASASAPGGWGVAAADFDGDGDVDLVLPHRGPPQLYLGDGIGRFDLAPDAFPGVSENYARGASAADHDGDGDLDLYFAYAGADSLWENEGGGHFRDVTQAAGMDGPALDGVHGAWGDYDQDGDLDLFVANYWTSTSSPEDGIYTGDPNLLWENRGDGTYEDRSTLLSWRNSSVGFTYSGGWWDLDGDFFPELYIINDKGNEGFRNALARWDGQRLVDIGADTGLDLSVQGMSLAVNDLNGDLLPDFLISDWGALALLLSDGAGGWYDASVALGLALPLDDQRIVAWGGEMEDLDNDGDLDLLVAFGNDELDGTTVNEFGIQTTLRQFDGVWLQGEDGHFSLATDTWDLGAPTVGRGFALADLDGNGWLDFVRRDIAGPAVISLQACGAEAWLAVSLSGPAPNTRGVGARVEVQAGGQTHVRWIHAGSTNIASSRPPEAHVGLGDADTVDHLRVTWPDGGFQEFSGIAARQRVTVVRD
jgi:hypothetical protein